MDKAAILEFLKQKELCTIATVSPAGTPESAVVGFAETDAFELIFGTYASSRKYQNIERNPLVSFVIGWEQGQTVQYEGVAKEVVGQERELCKSLFLNKNPKIKKFIDSPEERLFKVAPRWIRYTDLRQDPWEVIELTF